MANVKIPAPLRKLTGGDAEVEGTGKNIEELVTDLDKNYPGIKKRLYDEEGNLRKFVNVYVNGQDLRFLKSTGTEIKDGDEISIVPAVAGG